ncbi:hypothetical protein BDY21DRAFT_298904 [Lineolata rhizophorae]|uniref:Ribosomal RNA-processing protein 40 n=1 Tax=Lineolata rhizophorae TaxID=578093 RepID=A0A6A6P9T0_9PEZI|nr:hypothetical protein BDY21DRAFT_298904 [Lineolata rhizophorae]
MSVTAPVVVLPGDEIPPERLPQSRTGKKALTLGPGLRHIPPRTIAATVPGPLGIDSRKNAIWVDNTSGRYIPRAADLVVAQVRRSTPEAYLCALAPHGRLALLPHLAFAGATRKTRPQLAAGALAYARVVAAPPAAEPELDCGADPGGAALGRGDGAAGLGPLRGGSVCDVSLGMARRLLAATRGGEDGLVLLEELGKVLKFEVAVGRNGRVWVDGEDTRATVVVGRAIAKVDEEGLGPEGQRRVVRELVREVKGEGLKSGV